MPSAPVSRAAVATAVVLAGILAPGLPPAEGAAAAPTAGWSRGTVVGRSGVDFLGDEYSLPRVALSPDGRGTVVWDRWSGDATTGAVVATPVRGFGPRGALGPLTSLRLLGHEFVARDRSGHAVVTGAYEPDRGGSRGWIATQGGSGRWVQRVAAGHPASVVGRRSGFDVVVGKGDPGFTFDPPFALRRLGPGPTATFAGPAAAFAGSVTPDDGAEDHTGDGSSYAGLADGTVLTAGRRLGGSGNATGDPVLLSFAQTPAAVPLTGDARFGASAIDTAGDRVALAGLREIPVDDQGNEGIPEYAVGTKDGLTALRPIPGVPSHRGVEVDVAARPDGGAVVTWIQEPNYRINARIGQPHWAQISPAGEIEGQGTFSASLACAHMRIVRVGSTYVAVWTRSSGRHAAVVRSARLDGTRVSTLRAPAGTTLEVDYSDGNAQLVASGNHAAYVYADVADHTIRVASLRAR